MNTNLTNSTTGVEHEWTFTVMPIFLILIHAINLLLGFPLNVYIIVYLFPRRTGLDTLPDLNQAVVDILFVPLAPLHSLCSIKQDWCFYKPLGFFLCTMMSARTTFQCWVCVERYLAVVHPVTFLRYKPLRYRLGCSVLVWVLVLACGVTGMFTFPDLPFKVFTALYLVVLIVDIFCYMSILKSLRHPVPGERGKEEGDIGDVKKKAFQIVTIYLLTFLSQNIPTTIVFGLQNHLPVRAFKMATVISFSINIAAGFLQPVFVLRRAGKLSFLTHIWVHRS